MLWVTVGVIVVTLLFRLRFKRDGRHGSMLDRAANWLDRWLIGENFGTLAPDDGLQAWQLAEGLGEDAPAVRAEFRRLFLSSRVTGCDLCEGEVQVDGYLRPAFYVVGHFRASRATVVVHIGENGADLQISVRTFCRPRVSRTHISVLAGIMIIPAALMVATSWPQNGPGALGLGLGMFLLSSSVPVLYFSICRLFRGVPTFLPVLLPVEAEETKVVAQAAFRCALQAADSVGIPARIFPTAGQFGGERERLF